MLTTRKKQRTANLRLKEIESPEIIFQSEKDKHFNYFFLLTPVLLFLLLISTFFTNSLHSTTDFLFGLFIVIIISGMLMWFYTRTFYKIVNDQLIVVCGPLKWKIPVADIIKIRLHQKPVASSLWKASLSGKGIVIYFGKRMIYISPVSQNKFLEILNALNPGIEIK
jgi:hypothetical protein